MPKTESVRVREIANGFVVEHCGTDDDGGYFSTEHYMPSAPDLGPWAKKKPAPPMDPVVKAAGGKGRR